jgi:hypothetical protein
MLKRLGMILASLAGAATLLVIAGTIPPGM